MRKIFDELSFQAFKLKESIRRKRKAAVAFEYIIILVLMVVLIFAIWGALSDLITEKLHEIEEAMRNNSLSDTGSLGGPWLLLRSKPSRINLLLGLYLIKH